MFNLILYLFFFSVGACCSGGFVGWRMLHDYEDKGL